MKSISGNGEFNGETTTLAATGTSLNERFNEQNNSCARALQLFLHFFTVLCKKRREITKFFVV